jgi:BASS family bile acid:Na+ symporter
MAMISNLLSAIGRHAAIGFAASILLGLALPYFAAQARPLLPVSIFCFMVTTFLRADGTIILSLIRKPKVLLLSCLWLILAPLVIVSALLAIFGRDTLDPGLVLGLAILGAAPPIMSSPAVAIVYGFEPSLIIASVLSITALSPAIAPLLVDALAGKAVPLDASILMMRLAFFVGGGLVVALLLRRWLGRARVVAMKAELDGFGVVMYFIFAVAAMDGVTHAAFSRPGTVLTFIAFAVGIAAVGIAAGLLLLRFTTLPERFILGYGAGQRNMGLLIAALGAGVPETTFLFFALAQFPIYFAPWLLTPLANRIKRIHRLETTAAR